MFTNQHKPLPRLISSLIGLSLLFSSNSFSQERVDVALNKIPAPTTLLVDVASLCSQMNIIPTVEVDLQYATAVNLTGELIAGYHPAARNVALLTRQAALALCNVQKHLISRGLGLRIYDAYRPQRASKHFASWAKDATPLSDYEIAQKVLHYPNIRKQDLFPQGYITVDSTHNYGNAVDLTLVDLHRIDKKTKRTIQLDMGTNFDFMDLLSHTDSTAISEPAQENRALLAKTMLGYGFNPYSKEWWHFTHKIRETNYPMDLPITPAQRGLNAIIEQTE